MSRIERKYCLISTSYRAGSLGIFILLLIIQQIVTQSKYGHDALDICHPQVTDI